MTGLKAILAYNALWICPVALVAEITKSDTYTDLVQATPIGAAMIVVVYMFLRYLSKRDDADNKREDAHRDTLDRNSDALERVSAELSAMREHCRKFGG